MKVDVFGKTVIAVEGMQCLGEVDSEIGWITIGYIGSDEGVMLYGYDEWAAFVKLIQETDEVVQSKRLQ